MNIKVTTTYDSIRVYFGETLHLCLSRPRLVGFQSWREDETKFCIEYLLDGGSILCEYDSEEKWMSILSQLEKLRTLR